MQRGGQVDPRILTRTQRTQAIRCVRVWEGGVRAAQREMAVRRCVWGELWVGGAGMRAGRRTGRPGVGQQEGSEYRLTRTPLPHTHLSHTHTHLSHTHTSPTHTPLPHTHTSLPHTHLSPTRTPLSHTHTPLPHTHLSPTHTHLSPTHAHLPPHTPFSLCCRTFPPLLSVLSYIFCFHCTIAGPFCFYNDYIKFIEGRDHDRSDTEISVSARTPHTHATHTRTHAYLTHTHTSHACTHTSHTQAYLTHTHSRIPHTCTHTSHTRPSASTTTV